MEVSANDLKARHEQLQESIAGRLPSASIEPDFGD